MKRDFDLIREILRQVENGAPGAHFQFDDFTFDPPVDERTVVAHVELLIEAGYLDGRIDWYANGDGDLLVTRLRWNGHEFIQASRDDGIWDRTKQKVKSTTGSVTFDVFVELLKAAAKAQLGLP